MIITTCIYNRDRRKLAKKQKRYEHAKNIFNPANTQSPSEGSLNEKRHRVTGMWYVVPFHLLHYANTGILS